MRKFVVFFLCLAILGCSLSASRIWSYITGRKAQGYVLWSGGSSRRFPLGPGEKLVTAIDSSEATLERLQKQISLVDRNIERQGSDKELLYMVLLVHAGQSDKAIDFYRKHCTANNPGNLHLRMSYVQALSCEGRLPDSHLCVG